MCIARRRRLLGETRTNKRSVRHDITHSGEARELMPDSHSDCETLDCIITMARRLAHRWAARRTDYDTACDVAAEVAECVWRRTQSDPGFPETEGDLTGFALHAADGVLRSLRRSAARRARREEEFDYCISANEHEWMDPGEGADLDELTRAIADVLEHEPPRRRAAFRLVVEQHMSCKDAAEQLDVSVVTVRAHVRRIRVKLGGALGSRWTAGCAHWAA